MCCGQFGRTIATRSPGPTPELSQPFGGDAHLAPELGEGRLGAEELERDEGSEPLDRRVEEVDQRRVTHVDVGRQPSA